MQMKKQKKLSYAILSKKKINTKLGTAKSEATFNGPTTGHVGIKF